MDGGVGDDDDEDDLHNETYKIFELFYPMT